MRTWRKGLALIAACIGFALAWAPTGSASELFGYVTRSASGKVIMNIFGWNGVSYDLRLRPIHEAEAIDVVRRELLREQRIRDLSILVRDVPQSGGLGGLDIDSPELGRISLEAACEADYGTGGTKPPDRIGECYLIHLGAKRVPEDLLAMTLALAELSGAVRRIDVKDPGAFRSARLARIRRFRSLQLHFDPIWSPDGTRLLYTVVDSGGVRFELLEVFSRAVIRLQRLNDYMAARPIWSDDSRFIAYASLSTVKVFDTTTGATRTFRPKASSGGMQTLIQFEGTGLRFAFDIGFWGDYEIYLYDAASGTLQDAPPGRMLPRSDETHDLSRHSAMKPVRSPTGQLVALFRFVNGQRRIELKAQQ